MISRRRFIQDASLLGLGIAGGIQHAHAITRSDSTTLTILHTNDWHSRIDPFPNDGGRNAGRGGFERRAAAVQTIRSQEQHVLLLDSGDIFQGTPYFNFYGGEPELKLMSMLQYDAGTIGNHDFDNGLDGLARVLPHASFPLLNCNYDLSDTVMAGQTKRYIIKDIAGYKIGITGVGIELDGLVPASLYGKTRYLDPIGQVQSVVNELREEHTCDYVICLSHLGYRYKGESKIDDHDLAASTRGIDLILGGHTHTFLTKPSIVYDMDQNSVVINQAGWGGLVLGRVDVLLQRKSVGKCIFCRNKML